MAAACAAGWLSGCDRYSSLRQATGPRWPDLPLRDLTGRSSSLSPESVAGRIVNVWALWCPPCRRELPGLERLAGALAPRGIDVSAIALTDEGFPVREYLARYAPSLRSVVLSPKLPVVQELGLDALPQTFLLAADGTILQCWVGAREWDLPPVRAELDRVLEAA